MQRQFVNARDKKYFIMLYLYPLAYDVFRGIKKSFCKVFTNNNRCFSIQRAVPVAGDHFKGKNFKIILARVLAAGFNVFITNGKGRFWKPICRGNRCSIFYRPVLNFQCIAYHA